MAEHQRTGGPAASPIAAKVERMSEALGLFFAAVTDPAYTRRPPGRPVADFVAGNPQEMPLPGLVEALTRWSVPQHKDWFAYNMGDPKAQAAAAAGLTERLGLELAPEDVLLTRGAFGALELALETVVDPDDEVIFVIPPWFFYEALILHSEGTPVRVRVDPETFDLDVGAIARAISERTRALILNTPNNPTGKIYPSETLEGLAAVLKEASERNGRTIYIVSDESYSRILFDGREFVTPARFHPATFLVHTYSKITLSPGQRLGYLALPPSMPERERVRAGATTALVGGGFGIPDALMQYALPDMETLSIDLDHLERKRNRMALELRKLGYRLHLPEATFYLLVRSPIPDDWAFADLLARDHVYVMPGKLVEMPGYFRISLTATDEMIDLALPVFAAAIEEVKAAEPVGTE
ncbi:MAG: aminotransferase class I/II-fold pyridoxal phosphate-dependent enzyme [Actinomycetota bacterium]